MNSRRLGSRRLCPSCSPPYPNQIEFGGLIQIHPPYTRAGGHLLSCLVWRVPLLIVKSVGIPIYETIDSEFIPGAETLQVRLTSIRTTTDLAHLKYSFLRCLPSDDERTLMTTAWPLRWIHIRLERLFCVDCQFEVVAKSREKIFDSFPLRHSRLRPGRFGVRIVGVTRVVTCRPLPRSGLGGACMLRLMLW